MSVTLDALNAIIANERARIVRLSAESVQTLLFSLSRMQYKSAWLDFAESPTDTISDSDWDTIEAYTSNANEEIMTSLVGSLFPFISATAPAGALECDGSTYLRADYPDLYAALDAAFIVDGDHFVVPDMRGRAILGAGAGGSLTARTVNEIGGEETHVLTTGEMAAHNHVASGTSVSDTGHAHAEITAIPTLIAIGAGVPAPSAVPGAGVTGAGFASLVVTDPSISNTGGDGAHENMPPFLALKWGVWAT